MQNIKLTLVISAVVSLLAVIIGTPAMAQDKVVTMPVLVVKAPKCTVRALDQGSGNVKICE